MGVDDPARLHEVMTACGAFAGVAPAHLQSVKSLIQAWLGTPAVDISANTTDHPGRHLVHVPCGPAAHACAAAVASGQVPLEITRLGAVWIPDVRPGPRPPATKDLHMWWAGYPVWPPPWPPLRPADSGIIRYIELFAGVGGFRYGVEEALGKQAVPVLASEIDFAARGVYRLNHGGQEGAMLGDITALPACELPPHDLLTAGFPCQSFTCTGDQRGFDDPRGQLFFEIIRIARHHRPSMMLLENVPGLLTLENGAAWTTVRQSLVDSGYHVLHRVLSAASFVPQARHRLFIVCLRADRCRLRSSLSGEGGPAVEGFAWPVLGPVTRLVRDILEDAATVASDLTLSPQQWAKVQQTPGYLKSVKESPGMVDTNGLARTIVSHYRKGYLQHKELVPHPEGGRPRFFSPREVARMMGFPESFKWAQQTDQRVYHQLGNAVVPPLVASIVKAMHQWHTHTFAQ